MMRLLRGEQLDAEQQREDAADEEGDQHATRVHDADALVIDGVKPTLDALWRIEVVLPRRRVMRVNVCHALNIAIVKSLTL